MFVGDQRILAGVMERMFGGWRDLAARMRRRCAHDFSTSPVRANRRTTTCCLPRPDSLRCGSSSTTNCISSCTPLGRSARRRRSGRWLGTFWPKGGTPARSCPSRSGPRSDTTRQPASARFCPLGATRSEPGCPPTGSLPPGPRQRPEARFAPRSGPGRTSAPSRASRSCCSSTRSIPWKTNR